MDLTNEDVADILALLDSLPYDSLDVQTPRFRLTLRRAPGGWTEESSVHIQPSLLAPASDAAAAHPPVTPATGAAGGAAGISADAGGLAPVAAPLPGTFYRAPRPGAAPFVEVGDIVTPDTVVAIVETMKLMNPVHAGTSGRIARIRLENGEAAALGATLMLIEPGR
jgi:acetyl-CoA carboxylase biotin carboxyl carrier protein